MARKRARNVIHVDDSDDEGDSDFNADSYDKSMASDVEGIHQDDQILQSSDEDIGVDPNQSENVNSKTALYQLYLKKRKILDKIENKIARTMIHKSNKPRDAPPMRKKDTFTRFSVSYFSKVIEALDDSQKGVIERLGFGGLIHYDKCVVPNQFATWVAHLIDYRSGDIIVKDRIISITDETVHHVLGLPLTGQDFPRNHAAGKAALLARFNLDSMRPTKYFGDMIVERKPLSDDDLVTCFLIVAINCFLCPNCSLNPTSVTLAIFEDVENIKNLNWCGFVRSWLLERIKSFNRAKGSAKESTSLSCCLYLIAVVYLDFINFNTRQPSAAIPRVLVWKGSMIKEFSELDMISPGVYGFRPMLDISSTCYSKQSLSLHAAPSFNNHNSLFKEKLSEISNFKLSEELVCSICDLLHDHSIKSALSLNMDITSLSSLSIELKSAFSSLLEHAYSVDARTQGVVLKVVEMLSERSDILHSLDTEPFVQPGSEVRTTTNAPNLQQTYQDTTTHTPIHESPIEGNIQAPHSSCQQTNDKGFESAMGHEASRVEMQFGIHRSQKSDTPKTSMHSSFNAQSPPHLPDGRPSFFSKHKSRSELIQGFRTETNIAKLREASDELLTPRISNQKKVSFSDFSNNDVINLEEDMEYVPDSLSPLPNDISRQPHENKFFGVGCSIQFTQGYNRRIVPKLDKVSRIASSKCLPSDENNNLTNSEESELQYIGEKNMSSRLQDLSHKTDCLYNSNLDYNCTKSVTPVNTTRTESTENTLPFVVRDSSSGGRVPPHGPRRVVVPSHVYAEQYVNDKPKFHCSKSEIKNYDAICRLAATTETKDLHAVDIRGVHCTFKSFGDSFKPDGVVSNFVIAVFIRHLFMKPEGNPQLSKKHFFFSNVGDNLLSDPDKANVSTLRRAFQNSRKGRPLHKSDLLIYPILFERHWFVFIVDIKDKMFVFLDSYFSKDDEYQRYVRARLVPHFQVNWDRYIEFGPNEQLVDIRFDKYPEVYPQVPHQGKDNLTDCGIFTMMFLEHWTSPRTMMTNIFDINDIPKIRIKLANEMMFCAHNNGVKRLVAAYTDQDDNN